MFLPVSKKEISALGWDAPDFIMVIGEAYVDHPSFGHAIISRVLENAGYRVAILSLPDAKNPDSVKSLGRPRLAFMVSAGNMDSMVNHFTVNKKRRKLDAYAPGGKAGLRPDRTTITYCNMIRSAFKDAPIIIGGVEASLRRFTHYDYISDKLHHSILEDSAADLLVYGMGEKSIVEVAGLLSRGVPLKSIRGVRGTCNFVDEPSGDDVVLPSFDEIKKDKAAFAKAFISYYRQQDPITGKTVVQKQHRKYVAQNPPQMPLSSEELDGVYELGYMRGYHPMYEKSGGVPAIKEVEFSLTSSRGCFGGCSFCSINFHQGRMITARSHDSLVREATLMTKSPHFKGYIHDVGGPTANFRKQSCTKQSEHGMCMDRQCLSPKSCGRLEVDHSDYLNLLRKLRNIPGVKKVFVRSGVRYDYLLLDPKAKEFIAELSKHHVSGHLKVAPEHISRNVLNLMGKPSYDVFLSFKKMFDNANYKHNKEQYLVPYFISSHPGSDLNAAIELACAIRDMNITPEQVQDFYPTPGTLSTCMYYTGIDPRNMKKVYIPKGEEKRMQRALLQFRVKKNHDLVRSALHKAGREDLIGYGAKSLVPPEKSENAGKTKPLAANKTYSNNKKRNNRRKPK